MVEVLPKLIRLSLVLGLFFAGCGFLEAKPGGKLTEALETALAHRGLPARVATQKKGSQVRAVIHILGVSPGLETPWDAQRLLSELRTVLSAEGLGSDFHPESQLVLLGPGAFEIFASTPGRAHQLEQDALTVIDQAAKLGASVRRLSFREGYGGEVGADILVRTVELGREGQAGFEAKFFRGLKKAGIEIPSHAFVFEDIQEVDPETIPHASPPLSYAPRSMGWSFRGPRPSYAPPLPTWMDPYAAGFAPGWIRQVDQSTFERGYVDPPSRSKSKQKAKRAKSAGKKKPGKKRPERKAKSGSSRAKPPPRPRAKPKPKPPVAPKPSTPAPESEPPADPGFSDGGGFGDFGEEASPEPSAPADDFFEAGTTEPAPEVGGGDWEDF